MQENLTTREQELLNLLLEGVSPKEIAYRLHVSDHTVAFHRGNLYQKLGVQSIQELFAKYSPEHMKPALPNGELVPVNDLADPPGQILHFEAVPQKRKWLRPLTLAYALIFAGFVFLMWFFLIKPSVPEEDAIASHTYDNVYFQASRWDHNNGEHGETWSSKGTIRLSDFFTGTFKKGYKLQMSGTADKELEYVTIDIFEIKSSGEYKWVGGPDLSTPETRYFNASGSFNAIMAIDFLPNDLEVTNKVIIVELNNVMNVYGLWFGDFDNGKIPEHIRDGTRMATICDFTISVVK